MGMRLSEQADDCYRKEDSKGGMRRTLEKSPKWGHILHYKRRALRAEKSGINMSLALTVWMTGRSLTRKLECAQ